VLEIEINRDSTIPLYQQIFENISDREQLPSMRVLANKLGVSLMTIVKVYENLEKNQLIIRIQGKGSFVENKMIALMKADDEDGKFGWQLAISDYVPRNRFDHYFNPEETSYQLSVAAISPGLLPNRYFSNPISGVIFCLRKLIL